MAVACLDDPKQDFVKAFPGKIFAFGPAFSGYGYTPRYIPWLRANRHNYDAVVVHGLWQYPGFATWVALHKSEKPYVVFAHGMLDPWFKTAYPVKHVKKSIYWALAEHRVLKDAKAVLFTSEQEVESASGIFQPYNLKEFVVGLGASRPASTKESAQEAFFFKYPQLRSKTRILYLGRLHEKKGCLELLSAFSKVLSMHPESDQLHLVMAGSGDPSYDEKLKQYVQGEPALADRITWCGFITDDLKWGALHSASALILPSHQENFAVVVAEALACGKAVLISNKVNIWHEIFEAGAGLVESDDLTGIERLLLRWLGLSAADKMKMQANAKRCFEEKFEIHLVYDRLNSLLKGFALHASDWV